MGICTLVTLAGLLSPQVLSPGAAERAALVQVRAADAGAQHLLDLGTSRSSTFRELLEHIERSDLVVYIATDAFLPLAGKTQFVHSTARWRYLRVTVRCPGPDTELEVVAWLAHELQHVVEVSNAPFVHDDDALACHYHDVGWEIEDERFPAFETDAAKEIKWIVLDELYGG